jgi:transcriptional regulator with XRE-family HTH domain
VRLREARQRLELSQQGFADAVRDAGDKLGVPNRCTKRLVQKWESDEHAMPLPRYQDALARVTGLPLIALCTPALPARPTRVGYRFAKIITGLAELNACWVDLRSELLDLHEYLSKAGADPGSPQAYRDIVG